jgi:EmrB/QacA subfamily drug resistance transporter
MTDAAVQASRGTGEGQLQLSSSQGRWVLLATVLGTGLAAVDATVVGVALPAIGRDLHAPFSALQWTVTGYTLALASLILLGGAAGDRYGRRRILLIGVVWFAVASTICALASTSAVLIVARTFQGIGGALLIPASLAIIQSTFRAEDRARTVGAWAGLNGIAAGAAPFIGGWLLDLGSWRLVFLINPLLAVLVVAVVLRHVPETTGAQATGGLDLVGPLLAFMGLGLTTYAAIVAGGGHAAPLVVPLCVAAGLVGLAAFAWWEYRVPNPLVPVTVFRSAQFSGASLVTFAVYAATHGFLFLLVIQLQIVAGFSPLAAGAALLPLTIVGVLFSERSGKLAHAIGPRLQMTTGPLVCGAGVLLTLRVDADASYTREVLPALTLFGAGLAIFVAPLAAAALAAVPVSHAGAASGVYNAVARAARLLAVAALPGIVGLSGDDYTHPEVFLTHYRDAIWVCAATFLVGSLIAALTMSDTRPRARHLW